MQATRGSRRRIAGDKDAVCVVLDAWLTAWPRGGCNRVRGLRPGAYLLTADGGFPLRATSDQFAEGVALHGGPDFLQGEKLRAAVVEKNRLYFHRWRPQNETYLFGFRKHEQGRNAREIPLLDPLVEA